MHNALPTKTIVKRLRRAANVGRRHLQNTGDDVLDIEIKAPALAAIVNTMTQAADRLEESTALCSKCHHLLKEHCVMDSEPTLMCGICAEQNDQRVCGIPLIGVSKSTYEALWPDTPSYNGLNSTNKERPGGSR